MMDICQVYTQNSQRMAANYINWVLKRQSPQDYILPVFVQFGERIHPSILPAYTPPTYR